jgi:hypothetical protein
MFKNGHKWFSVATSGSQRPQMVFLDGHKWLSAATNGFLDGYKWF